MILTVGLGEGAQRQITSRINALGTNLLVVTPGSSTDVGGVRGGGGSASTLTVGDATALSSKVVAPDIAAVAPTVQRSLTLTTAITNWTTSVVGSTPSWLGVRARQIQEGRFLTASSDAGEEIRLRTAGDTVFEGVADRSQLKVGMKFAAHYMVPQGANAALGYDVMEFVVQQ